MTTQKVAANRANSTHSTGPRTPEGKVICSLNGLRDGLFASTAVLPGEKQADFDRIHDAIQQHYQPLNDFEQDMVDQLAVTKWKMMRTKLLEDAIFIEHGDGLPSACVPSYDRVMRVSGRLQRVWLRLRKELETIRVARHPLPHPPPPSPKPPAKSVEKPPAQPAPPPQESEEQWATDEEWERQTGTEKNYKRAERFAFMFPGPVRGEQTIIARLFRGKRVDKFPPCDNPDCKTCHPPVPPEEKEPGPK